MIKVLYCFLVLLASCAMWTGKSTQYRGNAQVPGIAATTFEVWRRARGLTFLTYTETVVTVVNPRTTTFRANLQCRYWLLDQQYDTLTHKITTKPRTQVLVHGSVVYSDYYGDRATRTVECSLVQP